MKILLHLTICILSLFQVACFASTNSVKKNALENPLIQIANMRYQGAFLLNSGQFGFSTMHDAEGGMAYAPPKSTAPHGSIFAAGNSAIGGVSEWAIPPLKVTNDVTELNMAESPLQDFTDLRGRAPHRRVNMGYFADLLWLDNQLLYSEHRFYPASNHNVHKLGVLRQAGNLSASPAEGYFRIDTQSGEEIQKRFTASASSGWMSKIPEEWHGILGGSHLLGPADGWSIKGRFAGGPSVFSFNPEKDVLGKIPKAILGSTPLVDYETKKPITLIGEVGEGYINAPSDLWNAMSFVHFGFIPPDSRTLMLVGNHWGLNGDISYKIRQESGQLCGGPCPFDSGDKANYYWLLDLKDVSDAIQGQRRFDSIVPYAYGPLPLPFQKSKNGNFRTNDIVGGAFDADSGTLYLQIRGGDPRPKFEVRPVMVAYKFDTSIQYPVPTRPKWRKVASQQPNSITDPTFSVRCFRCSEKAVSVEWSIPKTSVSGQRVKIQHFRISYENMDLSYANRKRHQRIGVTVSGHESKHTQILSPGNWKVTIRAISDNGVPSRL